MNSSSSNTIGSPFFCGMLNGHDLVLEPAGFLRGRGLLLRCQRELVLLRRGVMSYFLATFSAVMPMWYWLYTSHRPSTIMVSTSFQSPMRKPSREPGSTCGDSAHVLLAAGDDDLGVAAADRLRGEHHGLQARAADVVDGQRRHLLRQARS